MTNNIWNWVGVVALIVAGVALYFAWPVSFKAPSDALGATPGVKVAENYDPYLRYNGGYYSALPVYTTSSVRADAASTFAAATFSGLFTDTAGILKTNVNATTSVISETLAVTDVAGYDTVVISPNTVNPTLTFFASSTASTWLPSAGNEQDTCFVNGTTTAGSFITFAGGTGTKLLAASSSVSALGSLTIYPQKMGCFHFVRANSTATTFDILAAYTAYQ